MSSFAAYLEISGNRFSLHRYELSMHQEVDALGRPASPVLGGKISCTLATVGDQSHFLDQWMLSPTLQQDGLIRLLDPLMGTTFKTINFFNAYCTALDLHFLPGQIGSAGSTLLHLQISPQRIAVGAILHDNNWPVESHGSGQSLARQQKQVQKQKERQLTSEEKHLILAGASLAPGMNVPASLADAALYLKEGEPVDAFISLLGVVPVVSWFTKGGKVVRATGKGWQAVKNVIARRRMVGGTIRNVNKVGGQMNCANCSIAVDAVLAGRPASALNTTGPVLLTTLERFFGSKFRHGMNIKQIEAAVPNAGNRGIIFGNRGRGQVGHFFNVVNQKGTVRFLDGQTGKAAELTDGFIDFSILRTN